MKRCMTPRAPSRASRLPFDHRDPRHYNASVIQRLRSLRTLFAETVSGPDRNPTRASAKRRPAATEAASKIHDDQLAHGEIEAIADVPEPTHEEVMKPLQETLRGLGIFEQQTKLP
jgi:hypothetical protein